MTEKNKRIKEYIRNRDKGICQACGKYCWTNGNIAHRIAETKPNIKKYGREIIDHPYNKAWTCFGNGCNDSFNIGNKPTKSKELKYLIQNNDDIQLSVNEINKYINIFLGK